jgi:uncharacterized NAD(P)/FAD-binding protein YdhS
VPRDAVRRVIIIGGGASGVLLAYRLLSDGNSDLHVTIIEKRSEVGRGVAYCTANPAHLLNVRASNMSALPEDSDHFWRWLNARGTGQVNGPPCIEPFCFVPRRVYGDYIASLIEPLLSADVRPSRLHIIQGECVWIGETKSGITAVLADGCRLAGNMAVLATGNEVPAVREGCYADPWAAPCDAGIPSDAPVLILGTGLTMVDYALALLLGGHHGPIVAMSRRGLLPRPHRRVEVMPIEAVDVPFGADFAALFRWFRHLAEAETAKGGDWRSVVDGIRPLTQQIWLRLPPVSKRRFLEHARAWWDVHRHRMAAEVERRIAAAIAEGALTIIAGKICVVEANARGALVRYRRRGESAERAMQVAKIVECTGIVKNALHITNPAFAQPVGSGPRADRPLANRDRCHRRVCSHRSIRQALGAAVRDRAPHAGSILGSHRGAGYSQPMRRVGGTPARRAGSRSSGIPEGRVRLSRTASTRSVA